MIIDNLLENVRSVCITGHIRPDGDCAGSVLGLYLYIRKNYPEITADVYLDNPGRKLGFINGYDNINTEFPDHDPYDLMFCLDSASLDRIGKAEKYFKKAGKTVNIDHHISNTEFADENHVNTGSSSASEEVYKLMDPDKIDRDIAIALYTGIVFDTGVFKYPSTSPETMRVVAHLMEFDIPTDFIIDESFYIKGYNETKIFGYALMNSHLAYDGRVIYTFLSQKEIKEFGVSTSELDGIVPQLRLVSGVKAAFFMYQIKEDEVKLSLRSVDPVDVNKIAAEFGGGGHIRASGATLKGNLEECAQKVLEAIGREIC